MNKNKENIFYTYFSILTLMIALLTSCSKTHENPSANEGKTELSIKVAGIIPAEENFEISPLTSYNNQTNNDISAKSFSNNNLSFDISSSQEAISDSDEGEDINPSVSSVNNRNARATTTVTMSPGIKYRFLIYSKNTNTCIASILSTAGIVDKISVIEGQEYYWYAYSFNSTEDIPVPDENNPSVRTRIDKPLLYASGTISPTTGSNSLTINFKHQLAQVAVKIDSRGMGGEIYKISGHFDHQYILQTTDFDIRTGKKTGTIAGHFVEQLIFEDLNVGSSSIKIAKNYYTTDEAMSSFKVKITNLEIKYPDNTINSVTNKLPNAGIVTFSPFKTPNIGTVLTGNLKLSLILPELKIWTYSNNDVNGSYHLGPGSASGNFIRNTYNFGPNSKYVKIKNLLIENTIHGSSSLMSILLSSPANYPDVLIIANHVNYLDDASWNAVRRYLDAGGNVFYSQDNSTDDYANKFLSNLFGQSVEAKYVGEDKCVYKFTDTQAGQQDLDILNGVFGDVRPYHWGQDRVGTVYVQGYTGSNAIVYSNKSQNKPAPSTPGMAFFRHRTKNFFFVGDGGFNANPNPNGDLGATVWGEYAFRTKGGTGVDRDFPTVSMYGSAAQFGSPTYYAPHKGATGTYPVVNSMMFGNILAWMLRQATLHPVKRN